MTVVIQTQDADTSAADDPLLSYSVSTTPSPLKASPENPQAPEEIGEVVISVARQSGTPADVEWIRVKVPAGTMAPDLATDLSNVSPRISLTGWTVRLDAPAKEFVCAPTGSHAPIGPDTGFTIQLSDIPMSRKVGTAPITVTERSRTGNSAFQNRPSVFNLGKFPADFYLRNFLCEPSVIANGGDVKLSWERSANATYELLYGDVNRDVTSRTSLDLEGIKSDTTFYLRASTGDPTNPVIRIISAQVTVIKPDLQTGDLEVHGTLSSMGGALLYGESQRIEFPDREVIDETRYYRTPTDGFFHVWAHTSEYGTPPLFVDFQDTGMPFYNQLVVKGKAESGTLQVPVRGDRTVRMYVKTTRWDDQLKIDWIPLGTGSLTLVPHSEVAPSQHSG
ncbi:hypothetical protein [Streptomyces sp. NPDC002952]|uniref:hypothetical protein n=1 Tax=Streptomyces sp. NPDC002952 TaxID=3364673 RepID=UPI0036CD069A